MSSAPHPWVKLAVGRRGAGKTHWVIAEVARWRARHTRSLGLLALGIDGVATDPPAPHHLAAACDLWSPVALDELPAGIGLVAVDEADQWLPQAEARRQPPPPLVDLLRRGRHRGVSLLLATQRPALVAYDVWGLADEVAICHLTSARDLARVCELEGVAQHRAAIATARRPGPVVVWSAMDGARLVAP